MSKRASSVLPYEDDNLSLAGIAGSMAAVPVAGKASDFYGSRVLIRPTQSRYEGRTGDVDLIKRLVNKFKSQGGQMVTGANYYDSIKKQYGFTDAQMDAIRSNKGGVGAQVFADMYSPHYQPKSGRVFMPGFNEGGVQFPFSIDKSSLKGTNTFGPYTTPGMYAHEMGHALNHGSTPSYLRRLAEGSANMVSGGRVLKGMSVVGAASPLIGDDALGYTGAAASAIGLPSLVDEAAASARGYRMLRRLGAGRGKALGAFIGMPTYLAMSSAPMLPWAIRKADRAMHSE